MHIKKLFIRDFGIYNNASIDKIASGIVVFGGKNRAGKSTLLKLLRSFAYGIEKAGDLPPAKVEYEVEGEVEDGDSKYMNVRLKGYSKPAVTVLNSADNNGVDNLYGDVDRFTYSKIFTISLDELQNLEKDEERMQAVLLGAGLSDIIRVPKIVAEYKKEAEKIGGKNGNPKIKLFKPYSSSISEGLNIKQELEKQLHTYEKNLEELEKIKNEIINIEKENCKVEKEKLKVELLCSNYDIYSEMQRIKHELEKPDGVDIYNKYKDEEMSLEYIISLKDEYRKLLNDYSPIKLAFQNNIGDLSENLDNFKNCSAAIRNAQTASAAIAEKIKNYSSLSEYCKMSKLSLSKELMDINQEWTLDFTKILEINTEEVVFSELCSIIDSIKESDNKEKEISEAVERLTEQKKGIEEDIKNSPWKKDNFIGYYVVAAAFVIIGIIISIYNKNLGILAGVLGIVGAALYSFINVSFLKENKKYIFGKRNELRNINRLLSIQNEEAEKNKLQRDGLEGKLELYKSKLKFKGNMPMDSLKDYFRITREARKKALELKSNYINLGKLEENIKHELNELNRLAVRFTDALNFDEIRVRKNLIDSSEYLFDVVKRLNSMADYYEKFVNIKNLKENMENKISSAISCRTDNVAEAIEKTIGELILYKKYKEQKDIYSNLESQLLHSIKNIRVKEILLEQYANGQQTGEGAEELKQQLFTSFYTLIEKYISLDEIISEGKALDEKLSNNTAQLEKLKEIRLDINKENQDIYDNDNLNYAQQKIESGRRELKALGEKYAVYNAAAFILETLQKRFLEKTKDTLLVGAEAMLEQITGGEYVSILPREDLTKCDFITVEKEGTVKESTAILSRGTKEQLFLAVRLSRIKEIEKKLPIIIDDSLVNFDMEHLKNVIKVLKKLSIENQIFILTCHPEVVSSIMEQDRNAQYYELHKGKFSETNGKQLVRTLSVE